MMSKSGVVTITNSEGPSTELNGTPNIKEEGEKAESLEQWTDFCPADMIKITGAR